jgi:hypothetical protein
LLRLIVNQEDWKKISQQGIKRAKEAFDIYHSVELLEDKFAELLLKRDNYDVWREYQSKKINQNSELNSQINLSNINYLIFPNWQIDEGELTAELSNLIQQLASYKLGELITLVIDSTGISEEEANLLLSGIAMNLMLEENIDIAETLQISLLGELSEIQWQCLLPQISARIQLENENQSGLNKVSDTNLPIVELNN